MTPDEIISLMDDIAKSLHPRVTGNEMNAIIANRISSLAVTDRAALLEALRKYLAFRIPPSQRTHEHTRSEVRLWRALDIAESLKLNELRSDVESLLKDVKEKRALDPIDELSVFRSLERLKEQSEAARLHNTHSSTEKFSF